MGSRIMSSRLIHLAKCDRIPPFSFPGHLFTPVFPSNSKCFRRLEYEFLNINLVLYVVIIEFKDACIFNFMVHPFLDLMHVTKKLHFHISMKGD